MEMQENYVYCINQDTCVHIRGCKRWIGNYSAEDAMNESNNNPTGDYIYEMGCNESESMPFVMLDRFRFSDGTEFKDGE